MILVSGMCLITVCSFAFEKDCAGLWEPQALGCQYAILNVFCLVLLVNSFTGADLHEMSGDTNYT